MRIVTLIFLAIVMPVVGAFAQVTDSMECAVCRPKIRTDISSDRVIMPADAALDTAGLSALSSVKSRKNLIGRIIDYFNETNKPKKNKAFDFSIIGGPHYSTDTKFGIGLVAAGLYRTSRADTLTPPSDVAIYADATTSMFFKLGVKGTHIMPRDYARIHYDVNFSSVATKFWGIGYDNNVNDDNESKYKYLNSQAQVSFVWRIADALYIGPFATFDYINGRHFDKPWLWEGEDARTFNVGVGLTLQYDNRDFLTNASRGVFARLDQRFNPRFLCNRYAFSLTELTFAFYHKVWRSATLAFELHSRITYGNTPWGLLSTLGGSYNMRGYFEGRYRDKSEIDVCLELRQHVWRRNGIALWVGAGTVFPRFSALRWSKVLPNYGIGYRWEFKKKVNVRLDLGFGRHQTGFIFSINEAF